MLQSFPRSENPHDTAAEIGLAARSSPGLTPVRNARCCGFPLHDGARPRAAHLLAKSPDWLKAAPMWENLRTSWRQSEQKQDHCPSLLNHNAKYKRLLPPCCDFANGVPFASSIADGCTLDRALGV